MEMATGSEVSRTSAAVGNKTFFVTNPMPVLSELTPMRRQWCRPTFVVGNGKMGGKKLTKLIFSDGGGNLDVSSGRDILTQQVETLCRHRFGIEAGKKLSCGGEGSLGGDERPPGGWGRQRLALKYQSRR